MTLLEEYKKLHVKFWRAAPEEEGYISIEMGKLFKRLSPVERKEFAIWEAEDEVLDGAVEAKIKPLLTQ